MDKEFKEQIGVELNEAEIAERTMKKIIKNITIISFILTRQITSPVKKMRNAV